MDYISIGSTPCEEDCAQVGTDGYYEKALKECRAYIQQLLRELGELPANTYFSVKSFPHNFGTYYEVVCWYDDAVRESVEYAFKAEGECSGVWDEEAKKELAT